MRPDTTVAHSRGRGAAAHVLEPLVVLVAFAAAGAGAGWLWERWWTPTRGVVVDGTWVAGFRPDGDAFVFDFPSLEGFFAGTAQYVVLGLAGGVVLGVLCGLLGQRSELVMLFAVVVGSALAGLVAYRLGTALGPVDPTTIEGSLADGTVLPANLSVPGASPFVAWPLGALLGLGAVYLFTSAASQAQQQHDATRWMQPAGAPPEPAEGSTDGPPGRHPARPDQSRPDLT